MSLMRMKENSKKAHEVLFHEGMISKRFRNIFIALFTLAFICMLLTMLVMYNRIITQLSFDYAGRSALSAASALSAHIEKEIGFLAKAARSRYVVEWILDEENMDKKSLAFIEMSDVVRELYSENLYVGIHSSRNEYTVGDNADPASILPIDLLDSDDPINTWYYTCINADTDYTINVGVDSYLHKKRVWLNYKVTHDGVPIGVICTGLDFSQVARELFSIADDTYLRSIIIDNNGFVLMDSELITDEGFLYRDVETHLSEIVADSFFLAAIDEYLGRIDGHFEWGEEPLIMHPASGRYRYATITPIQLTMWTSVALYNTSPFLSLWRFLPAFSVILLLLVAFTLAINTVSDRLIFMPLDYLIDSLSRMKENHQEQLYGLDREDELGSLSRTIIDLFTKANYDALTGVYNRRFMETLLQQNMEFLSRSGGELSVLMADVDFFKLYNDTYGHQEGDECLKKVARALSDSITRNTDFVARYGGEEFVAVLPNTDAVGARIIARKILEGVSDMRIPHASSNVAKYVTVSLGVTSGKVYYSQSWSEYVKCADDALYASKQNGRNQFTFVAFPGDNAFATKEDADRRAGAGSAGEGGESEGGIDEAGEF